MFLLIGDLCRREITFWLIQLRLFTLDKLFFIYDINGLDSKLGGGYSENLISVFALGLRK